MPAENHEQEVPALAAPLFVYRRQEIDSAHHFSSTPMASPNRGGGHRLDLPDLILGQARLRGIELRQRGTDRDRRSECLL